MTTRRSFLGGASAAIVAGAAPRSAWAATEADVVIIGAGLAGLFAAHRLELEGAKVVIVEALSHVGGRMRTLDDLPGHPEAGGIQIGAKYNRLLDIADDLKVPLKPDAPVSREALYRINGVTVAQAVWAASPANRTSGAERALPPAALGGFYAGKLPQLTTPEGWLSVDMAGELDTAWAAKLREFGASAEAMRLIGANLNGNSIETLSALHLARSAAIFRAGPGPGFTVRDGSQRIPEALAKFVTSPIRLDTPVRAIGAGKSGVTVTLAKGGAIRAKHAICTIPFAALRNLPIEGAPPEARQAIASLPYTFGTFVYIAASEPFWKSDGHPETLWTDDPLLGRVFVLGDDPPMLKVFATGQTALALDRLDPQAAMAECVARIEAARPAAKGKLRPLKLFSWQREPTARGIYHHLSPGMVATMAVLAQRKDGRLHFAGEHLAIRQSGMEGALESGDRIGRMVAGML